ncbi:MAG: hypothetical protein KDC87_13295 [Planctomycetes bacterium]|nr:hypothetical protein [Planctomycetota bacterium]MCB9868528.1 hypothetical protein [Planctomycetota bacterium]
MIWIFTLLALWLIASIPISLLMGRALRSVGQPQAKRDRIVLVSDSRSA